VSAVGRAGPVIELTGVVIRRDGANVLDGVDWTVHAGERWVILGPNGSGKTTLLGVAGARLWPTAGSVRVLGAQLGRVDVRTLRPRIALVSGSVTRWRRGGIPTTTRTGSVPTACSVWPAWARSPGARSG
jgi:iron complex transport system ATP-binding protein